MWLPKIVSAGADAANYLIFAQYYSETGAGLRPERTFFNPPHQPLVDFAGEQANGARRVDKGLTIGRADSGVHARDIEENARFQLLFVEAVLHEITDTHTTAGRRQEAQFGAD